MSILLRTAQDVVVAVGTTVEHTANRLLPPKQRERALETLRAFSVRNPKLASFLAVQTALAGLPVLLFLVFAVATLVISLITCLFLGIIAALAFTLFTTGFALLFVVPVVFIGSCTATIVFLWCLAGYLLVQRLNGGETPVHTATTVSDTLNGLTSGRLHDLADRGDSDLPQECLAVDSSSDEKVSMGRESGRRDRETRSSPPRRRHHGHTNGSGHSRDVVGDGQEGGAQHTELGLRDNTHAARDCSDAYLVSYEPRVRSQADWKAEFQQTGMST
ncbi:hypothetical protein C7974DRAFT_398102 [Boeremia exigua]|uniref:uncharacterized protein n=1 Tax=Boeremia exigua TaxID=749465 RepID=UPI001E8EA784|nr:uncharacterized protein C7974DRAFT_398102 [Boeremia exigua]KAH6622341.1 hypothetical protein C7974DRAFT_398102 [Boeremia exigua]